MMDNEEANEGEGKVESLIRAYGEYWSRDAVNWGGREIRGQRRNHRKTNRNDNAKEKICNVWFLRGVYALYSNFRLVYVGLAKSEEGIGGRLVDHNKKPRFRGRWDSFSWFGVDGFDRQGKMGRYDEQAISAEKIARTLELIAILIADPPLNRSQGKFKGAEKIDQAPLQDKQLNTEVIRDWLRKTLEEVGEKG